MANRNVHSGLAAAVSPKSAFQLAVEKNEYVRNGFCSGLQAIKESDRGKVEVADTKKLQGSLDIDSQVKALYPEEPRWDYAVSYNDRICFFEVHSAETSEVAKVIRKLDWLKQWLKSHAPEIDRLPKAEHPYVWVQSGRYAISPLSSEKRKLAVSGIFTTNKLRLK